MSRFSGFYLDKNILENICTLKHEHKHTDHYQIQQTQSHIYATGNYNKPIDYALSLYKFEVLDETESYQYSSGFSLKIIWVLIQTVDVQ